MNRLPYEQRLAVRVEAHNKTARKLKEVYEFLLPLLTTWQGKQIRLKGGGYTTKFKEAVLAPLEVKFPNNKGSQYVSLRTGASCLILEVSDFACKEDYTSSPRREVYLTNIYGGLILGELTEIAHVFPKEFTVEEVRLLREKETRTQKAHDAALSKLHYFGTHDNQ